MPACFVPGCRSGYRTDKGKHFFTPPKDEKLFSAWARAIPRKDIPLTRKSAVCECHFADALLIKADSFVIDGKHVEIPRIRWTLKPGAVPHIFPSLPSYLSKKLKVRKSPVKRESRKESAASGNSAKCNILEVIDPNHNLPSTSKLTNSSAHDPPVIQNLKKRIRNLNRNLKRTQNKLAVYKAKINLLERKTRQINSTEAEDRLSCLSKKQKLMVDTMLKKCNARSKGMRYSNEFILDSLLLKIKSPRGYRHCLKHELLPLPSESHLRKLCKGFKSNYGVNGNAINAIKEAYANEKDENKRLGILIFDEVKLREDIRFNSSTLKIDGFVDLGDETPDSNKNILANHALVFMFVPLLCNWIQPVAIYASKNATPGDILSKILIQVIIQLEQSGVKVIAFTCDGSQSNKRVWTILGISGKEGKTKCFIENPVDHKRKIWAFSDSVHIFKCIRNHFHDKVNLIYKSTEVNYEFYRKLFKIDTSCEFAGLRSCPKLTSSHIDPNSFQRMNARLAFQLFSNSVANAIRFFREMKPNEFRGSENTECLTRDVNNLVDVLNSTLPVKGLYKGCLLYTSIIVIFANN